MKTLILLLLAATALSGCAGVAATPVASTPAWCVGDLARQGVAVTSRGTQLALRPTVVPRLQPAALRNRAGSAVLSCKPVRGSLTRCVVLYEEPGGQGLGRLALGYADRVIYPSEVEGETAEVRFRFDAPAGQATTACS